MNNSINPHFIDERTYPSYYHPKNHWEQTASNPKLEDSDTPSTFKKNLSQILIDRAELSKNLLKRKREFFLASDNRCYYVTFNPFNKELSLSKNAQSIGDGYSGTVFKMIHLTGQRFRTEELALKLSFKRTKEHIKNEIDILEYIHRNGKVAGIQTPPYLNFTTSKRAGYLAEKYKNDLWDLYVEKRIGINDPETANHCLTELIMGLKNLIDRGIYHGDIKPENCAVRLNERGKEEYFLADFGGAIDQRDLKKLIQGTTSSREYKPSDIGKEFIKIRKKVFASSPGPYFNITEKLTNRLKRNVTSHDVYSLGLTLRLILSGGDERVAEEKIPLLLGEKKSELLEGMLHNNPQVRVHEFNMLVMLLEQERRESPSLETPERKESLP